MEAPNCGWHYKTFGMDFCDAPPLGGGGILGVAIGEWAAPRKPRMRGRVADQGGRGAARGARRVAAIWRGTLWSGLALSRAAGA